LIDQLLCLAHLLQTRALVKSGLVNSMVFMAVNTDQGSGIEGEPYSIDMIFLAI